MMQCPKCQNQINCKLSINTEDKDMPIYFSYQWWYCETCGSKYYGLLEESKVNIFDDRLEHQGYYTDEKSWQESLQWARKCPDPKNSKCKCEIHHDIPLPDFRGISAWYTYE
jgi:hypothetical protein